jgi:3-phenylpropionate/trans-cinnamate dioxygenase ferredoxin reductase component
VSAVHLSDGSRVEAELVLFALGSVPNTEWVAGSGLRLLDGVLLCGADCLAVGDERIAGAGDVAAWAHPQAGGQAVCVEHWTNAREMARAAAANLLASPDQRAPFAPVPSFWSDQYDASIKSAGLLQPGDRVLIVEDEPRERRLVVERHREDRLVAAVTLNRNASFVKYKRKLAEEH